MLAPALLVVSVVGLALSIYTTVLQVRAASCGETGACEAVMSAPAARLFGFPNAALASAYFAALGVFGGLRWSMGPVLPLWPALTASAFSLVMSAYLAWVLLIRMRRT